MLLALLGGAVVGATAALMLAPKSGRELRAEIAAIARFAESLAGVQELHLLPYHRLGTDKYAGLGREYTLAHATPPTAAHMQALKEAAERESQRLTCHLRVQIGG